MAAGNIVKIEKEKQKKMRHAIIVDVNEECLHNVIKSEVTNEDMETMDAIKFETGFLEASGIHATEVIRIPEGMSIDVKRF